jgi:hypothetical protein
VTSVALVRHETEAPVLAELGEWIVTGVAAAGTKLVARCSQMHLDDAVRVAWRFAQARHPTVDPATWLFRCHMVGDGRASIYYRVGREGLFLLPLEVLPGNRDAPDGQRAGVEPGA